MFSMLSRTTSRGPTSPQCKPALRHDKRGKQRRLTPTRIGVGLLCLGIFVLVLWMRLRDNDLNAKSSIRAMKKLVDLAAESNKQQQVPDQTRTSSPLTASVVLQRPLSPAVKVHKLTTSNLKSCPHTIVTGYFQLRSKYTADTYIKWMANMLSIQDCVVVITSANMVETISSLRQHALDATVIIEMEVDDLPISQLHADEQKSPTSGESSSSFWPHQLDIDREKKRHKSYQLFWIWLSKTWCVVQAIQKDYFHSNLYMWQDIGAFRDKKYNGKTIIQHPEVVPNGTLLWMAHHPPNPPKSGPIWNDKSKEKVHYFHSGSQAAGAKEVWLEYHVRFAEVMDQFLEKNMFIGEDQCVLQGTCQKYPDLCAYIPATDVKDNHYFGLRYALHHGIKTKPWQMPGAKAQTSRRL